MLLVSLISILGTYVSLGAAHGAVTSYNINGVEYAGHNGYSPSSTPIIQRPWPSYDPIMSVTSGSIRCNGGTRAGLNATLKAGDKVTAKWVQWTHEQGPIMVWLYKCGDSFSSCDGGGKGWFKIDQSGLIKGPLTGKDWGTGVVYKDKKWTTTVPARIAAGNYLIRHELIALHQANAAQFYPECAQIVVTGGGGELPSAEFLTSIPGYATMSDPGIRVDIYSAAKNNITNYKCPGPEVWS